MVALHFPYSRQLKLHYPSRRISINSLPIELISHIFHLGTFGSTYEHEHPGDGSEVYEGGEVKFGAEELYFATTFPVLVSHVCRQWRYIALSNARLWSTIIIAFPQLVPDSTAASPWMPRALTFLSRSSNYPLHIHVDLRSPSYSFYSPESTHPLHHTTQLLLIFRILLPHISRWSSFTLLSDIYSPIHTFVSHCQSHEAPLLKRVALARCNAYFAMPGEEFQPVEYREPLRLFKEGGTTMLKHVELTGVHIDWDSTTGAGSSSLRNLQSIELKYHSQDVMPTLPSFIHMLNSSPFLMKLVIMGWGPQSITELECVKYAGSIELNGLEEFQFGWVDVEYASRLLSLFSLSTFAKVRRITLEDIGRALDPTEALGSRNEDSSIILELFVSAYSATANAFIIVENVSLSSIKCSAAAHASFLSGMRSMKRLEIDGMDMSLLDGILSDLSDDSHSLEGKEEDKNDIRAFLPQLEHISLRNMHLPPNTEEVVNVNNCSCAAFSCLTENRLDFDFDVPSAELESFRRNMKGSVYMNRHKQKQGARRSSFCTHTAGTIGPSLTEDISAMLDEDDLDLDYASEHDDEQEWDELDFDLDGVPISMGRSFSESEFNLLSHPVASTSTSALSLTPTLTRMMASRRNSEADFGIQPTWHVGMRPTPPPSTPYRT